MSRKSKLQKFRSKDGFRWRLRSTNGRIIADGAEAYSSASALNKAVASVVRAFGKGVEVLDLPR